MTRVVCLIVLAALSSCTRARSPRSAGGCSVGAADCRPPLRVKSLEGSPAVTEESLAGKIVLLNFWATWCAPCAQELPDLDAVYRRHAEHGFVTVGLVSSDRSSDDDIYNFASARGVTFPLARSTPELESHWGLGSILPVSLLFDRGGNLRMRWNGSVTEAQLEAKVQEILASQ